MSRSLPMKRRTLLFVDSHPLYRDGLSIGIGRVMTDHDIVTAPDIAEAETSLDEGVDLCFCDRWLPDGSGVEFLAHVRRHWPAVATGLLTSDILGDVCQTVEDVGGAACLSKTRDARALSEAVRSVLAGGTVFDRGEPQACMLTDRRRDIVRMAALGWGDKRICSHLAITQSGVRGHWHHIFGRLGANNRTEAVTKAMSLRLI